MSNIVKNYFRVLEVISSLNVDLEYKSGVGRIQKMSDLEVVALSLTAEFMFIHEHNGIDQYKFVVCDSAVLWACEWDFYVQ